MSGLCSGENTKNSLKTDVFKLFSGAEGEIRTLARFLDDYSLSRGEKTIENTGEIDICNIFCSIQNSLWRVVL